MHKVIYSSIPDGLIPCSAVGETGFKCAPTLVQNFDIFFRLWIPEPCVGGGGGGGVAMAIEEWVYMSRGGVCWVGKTAIEEWVSVTECPKVSAISSETVRRLGGRLDDRQSVPWIGWFHV
jgi:hypothetical protein